MEIKEKRKQMFYTSNLESKLGMIQMKADTEAVISIQFVDAVESLQEPVNENALTIQAVNQFKEYFSGKRKTFDIPIRFHGTEFQREVWNALLSIPYGTTKSYKDICKMIGKEKASRAVGTAIGKNPILIAVPCHRVIASNGKLAGYAGGILTKKNLLEMESRKEITFI